MFFIITERPRNELGDTVADSEESEDEWNYYRPKGEDEDKEDKPTTTTGKDPALVENPDRCETEKELCSPKPSEEDDDEDDEEVEQQREHEQLLLQQQQEQPTSSSGAAAAAELDDEVTAEFDDLHHDDPTTGFEIKDVSTLVFFITFLWAVDPADFHHKSCR